MVHTRGQKLKEENETKVAEQRSLAEQVQQASVSRQLLLELDANTISLQHAQQEDVSERDVSQVDVSEQNVSKPECSNLEVVQPEVVQPEVVQPEVTPNVAKEDAAAGPSVNFDAGEHTSEYTVVKHLGRKQPGDDGVQAVDFTHKTAEAAVNESDSIISEDENSEIINDVTTLLDVTMLVVSKKRNSASFSNPTASKVRDLTIPASIGETGLSRRYALRSRAKETGKTALAKVEESAAVLSTAERRNESTTDTGSDSDGGVGITGSDGFDELADLSASDTKVEERDVEYQLPTARHTKMEGKPAAEKTATNKTTSQQMLAFSELASESIEALAQQQDKAVQPNVEAIGPTGERSVRAKGRSALKDKRVRPPSKDTRGKKNAKVSTRVSAARVKVFANPEEEDEFVPENGGVSTMIKTYGLRDRTKTSKTRKRLTTASSRATNSSRVSSSKKTRGAKILKARKKDPEEKKLIVKLSLPGKISAILKFEKIKKKSLKRARVPKGFFTNNYRFKFGWTPFEEYPQVDEQTYHDVLQLLTDSLAPDGISLERKGTDEVLIEGVPQGPMHANDTVTVDAIVKVIMSQATDNTNALSAQARLLKAFPFVVDGETVVGETPNYHDIRLAAGTPKLSNALRTAGLHEKRAVQIPECLHAIRRKNIEANSLGCSIDSNPPNTAEFVPGSLSLEYMHKLTKDGKMDELLSLPAIGIKTAMCVLAFAFGLPVFAVDTHVHRLVSWLGWIPAGANANDAAVHLDKMIPDDLKYGLHQGFWHHGQRCIRCKAGNDENTKGWKETVCVLEKYLKREPRKERKSPERKRKREAGEDEGAGSPKPKTPKGNKTIISKDMTDEEAAAMGGWRHDLRIDDNFGTLGANYTKSKTVIFT